MTEKRARPARAHPAGAAHSGTPKSVAERGVPRRWPGQPGKQGLYDPAFEHEACGVGFVVDMKGRKSHRILQQAIQVLRNLDHRGACGCEANTGDGAGVLIQMPHTFFQQVAKKDRFTLPGPGEYGSGLVFLPRNPNQRRKLAEVFEHIIESEGPDGARLAHRADQQHACSARRPRRAEPFIRQVFIGRDPAIKDEMEFERKLYVIRKRAYSEIRTSTIDGAEYWYLLQPFVQDHRLQRHAAHRAARAVLPGPACTRRWKPRWRSCTRASARTPSRAGIARIRIDTSPTTARSTRCAATTTG